MQRRNFKSYKIVDIAGFVLYTFIEYMKRLILIRRDCVMWIPVFVGRLEKLTWQKMEGFHCATT